MDFGDLEGRLVNRPTRANELPFTVKRSSSQAQPDLLHWKEGDIHTVETAVLILLRRIIGDRNELCGICGISIEPAGESPSVS